MITAQMVKEIREKTGAGIMDCKKALSEAKGDIDKASEIIRKKGIIVAVKKADRITAEGIIEIYVSDDNKSAGIVELNCETDFVADNNQFTTLAKNLAKQASLTTAANIDDFVGEKYIADENTTINENITALVSKLGENMLIRRFKNFHVTNNIIQHYIHGGGRIGSIVEIHCTINNPSLKGIIKDLAIQVAATNPLFLDRNSLDEEALNKKIEGFKIEAINEGKPEKIIEKIVEGKIQKYLKEVCLLEQVWVKNLDYTIKKYLEEKSKEIGALISIVRFVRFERGDGMEKKEENFAEEVQIQIQNRK